MSFNLYESRYSLFEINKTTQASELKPIFIYLDKVSRINALSTSLYAFYIINQSLHALDPFDRAKTLKIQLKLCHNFSNKILKILRTA